MFQHSILVIIIIIIIIIIIVCKSPVVDITKVVDAISILLVVGVLACMVCACVLCSGG